jgi:hypothetical protein
MPSLEPRPGRTRHEIGYSCQQAVSPRPDGPIAQIRPGFEPSDESGDGPCLARARTSVRETIDDGETLGGPVEHNPC